MSTTKPLYPDYLITEPDLWNKSHDDAVNHIHPKTIKARNESKLQDYLNSSYGSGSVAIMLKLIDNNEITHAITSLKNRKSVGKDGITAEIIKQNQNWIIPLIKTILHNCQITYAMPKQWLRGIMTFIPKGKKDKSTLKNSRPITLLNIVYKIWAIIYTNRLTPYMNLLTQETQSAYKTGRSTIDILSL